MCHLLEVVGVKKLKKNDAPLAGGAGVRKTVKYFLFFKSSE